MLIPCSELSLVYGVHAHGILHVGAHEAEELESYHSYGWGPVIWVEMLPEKFERLKQRFEGDSNNTVIHAACWDSDGDNLPLFRASNNGASSSLLSPQLHLVVHPRVSFVEEEGIRTSRLDSILPKDTSFDLINFDIQGAELQALRGLGEFLDRVKWAYLEINERPLYTGCALLPELDAFLQERRFVRIAIRMSGFSGWGDALYMNTSHLSEWSLLLLKLRMRIRSWWQLLPSRAKALLHKRRRGESKLRSLIGFPSLPRIKHQGHQLTNLPAQAATGFELAFNLTLPRTFIQRARRTWPSSCRSSPR